MLFSRPSLIVHQGRRGELVLSGAQSGAFRRRMLVFTALQTLRRTTTIQEGFNTSCPHFLVSGIHRRCTADINQIGRDPFDSAPSVRFSTNIRCDDCAFC